MSQTYTASNYLMDQMFGNVAFTVPATLYMGLTTNTITAPSFLTSEPPSGYGYARVAITNDKSNFSNAVAGAITNNLTLTFPEATTSWGTILSIGLWDALTGGNLWWFEALPVAKTVQASTTVLFTNGALTLSQTN
jgi:hypothetical protein